MPVLFTSSVAGLAYYRNHVGSLSCLRENHVQQLWDGKPYAVRSFWLMLGSILVPRDLSDLISFPALIW